MDQVGLNGFLSSVFVPAFMAGLGDSINPCNFATLVIFITVLSNVGHTPKRLFLFGALFIVVAGAVQCLSVLGSWDQLLTLTVALDIISYGYLLIAAAFLFLGVTHILDWWKFKKYQDTECFTLKVPVFFQDKGKDPLLNSKEKPLAVVFNILVVVFISTFMSVVGVIYPQNEYVFVVHSFLMAGGDRGFVFQSFGFYSFAMILPLVIAWLVIWFLTVKEKNSIKVISYYKGISAVLFIATGIGLGYFFLN